MKIQRKLAGFSACALVLSSLTVPVAHAAEVDFNDIDSHWAKSSIERWAGYEVVNGMGNNQFKPEDTMTRAQMAQILSKTLGLTATTTTNPFSDVKDTDWFKDAILKCNAAGIMNGTSATTAKPNDPISRQDAVTMMSRALGIEADGDSTSFDDNGSIGSWAVGFVNAMAKRGIVNGRSEGMFAPTGDIKRGEIVTILDRAITTYVNTPDTEVTATGKGITLIAASGVTVKGEAEDILVAPAAAGTTKLDGVKVSGAVTMQAANGTLVLGGATTAAKLNIPALATGAKITIEKDATVAAVSSSADNVAIDGNGTITAMTVETGKGVTVAGSVKVGKITNNSQDSMKHGNNVIAGVGGTKPSTGGGGSSGGSGGGGSYTDDNPIGTNVNAKTWQDLIDEATKDGVTNPYVTADNFEIKNRESATIILNDDVKRLDLELKDATADTLTIRAQNAKIINITGDVDDQIGTLIIDAPNATVTSEITVGEANIEKVGANSYHPNKKHGTINMKGKGKLVVPTKDSNGVDMPAPEVVVLSKNKDDKVTISGDVTKVTVKSPAEIILDAISKALTLTSENKNANITVNANNSNNVTLTGDIKTLKADGDVKLEGATVADATVAEGATITGDSATTITTVTAKEEATTVSLSGAMTVSAVKTTETTTTVNLNGTKVTSVTTSTSLEIKGSGSVASVDVVNATTKVTITNSGTVTVTTVTAVGDTKVEDIDASGANATNKNIQKKAPAPTGLAGKRSDTWGESGKITGAKAGQEYKAANDETAEWTSIKADGDITVDALSTTGGSYLVRTATSTTYPLASEPVTVVVPAQVGVQSAEIFGSAVAGQELKAVANSTVAEAADNVGMKYVWKNGEETVKEGADATTYTAENNQILTVTISNYDGKGGEATSDPVYTEEKEGSIANIKAALKKLIEAAEANIKDFKTSEDGKDILPTEQYVKADVKKAYEDAIKEANDAHDTATTAKDISDAMKALKAATAAFNDAKKYGTQDPATAPATYKIEADANVQNVTLAFTVDGKAATETEAGKTVTVTATPVAGFKVDAVTVTDTTATKTEGKDNEWTFTMPAKNVTVSATVSSTGGGDQEDNSTYSITFDANTTGLTLGDGVTAPTAPTSITGLKNEDISAKKPTDLTLTGYTFGGWFTDAACTEDKAFDFANPNFTALGLTADESTDATAPKNYTLTLYAKWTAADPQEVTVTFTIDDKTIATGEATAVKVTDENDTAITSPLKVTTDGTVTFKVSGADDKTVTVVVGSDTKNPLTPANGIYTISNVTADTTVTITVEEAAKTVALALTTDALTSDLATDGTVVNTVSDGTATAIDPNENGAYELPSDQDAQIVLTFNAGSEKKSVTAATTTKAVPYKAVMSDSFKMATITIPTADLAALVEADTNNAGAALALTLTAKEVDVKVNNSAPMVDHSTGSDVDLNGSDILDVTLKAPGDLTDVTIANNDNKDFYVIELATKEGKTLPQHMNADTPQNLGFWAGYAIHKDQITDFTNVKRASAADTFPTVTSSSEKDFNQLDAAANADVYGAAYVSVGNYPDLNADGLMYLSVYWDTDNIDYFIVDTRKVKLGDQATTLKNAMTNRLTTKNSLVTASAVTNETTTAGTAPTYKFALTGSSISSAIPSGYTGIFDTTLFVQTGTPKYTVAELPFLDVLTAGVKDVEYVTVKQTNPVGALLTPESTDEGGYEHITEGDTTTYTRTKTYALSDVNGDDGGYAFLLTTSTSPVKIEVFKASNADDKLCSGALLATYEITTSGVSFS